MTAKTAVQNSATIDLANDQNSATDLLSKASAAIAVGDNKLAATTLDKICALIPNSLELLMSCALAHLNAGEAIAAEKNYRCALAIDPTNCDILHNLALINWTAGKIIEARNFFEQIATLQPDNPSALNDLAVFEEQQGDISAALRLFDRAAASKQVDKKTLSNYVNLLIRLDKHPQLESIISQYKSSWGSDEEVRLWEKQISENRVFVPEFTQDKSIHVNSSLKGLKIAFFSTYSDFLIPIIDELKTSNQTRLIEKGTEKEINALLEWCDLAWFEWCDALLIQATKLPKKCKIVCRLHSYEVFTEMPRQVDWSKVDHLILVNKSIQVLLTCNVDVPTPTTIIHNGVDTEKFQIPRNKEYGKSICSIGYINYKKNPALLLYCFKAIHDYDNAYSFHIAGEHQDPRIQVYFNHLLPRLNIPVFFDGWVKDIPAYLHDKDYVISTSLFESFHYSIAEGMASGVIPLIHDWMGAEFLYPREFIFNTPDSCLQLLKTLEKADRPRLGQECRQHIVANYDQRHQFGKITAVLQEVMSLREKG